MSCPQEAATQAWIYGEGDEAQVHHIVGCAACTAALTAHEAVLSAVRPIAPALARPRRYARWPIAAVAAAVALAAGTLVVWRGEAPPAPPPSELALDDQLTGLDAELSTLADDLDDRSSL